MEEGSIQATAFGKWELLVMPFGLSSELADELGNMDDIFIFSRLMEERWGHLQQALQNLQEAKLYGRLCKREFSRLLVDYIGFEVSANGVHASP